MGLTVAALRTSSALWAAPLVLLLTWYVVGEEAFNAVAHWGHNTTAASYVLPFYGAACAACAAWEAGRLRKAGVYRLAPTRSRFTIVLSVLWPVLLLGIGAVAVALLRVRLSTGPAHDWPHLGVLALCGYLIVVHTVVGFVVGSLLPRWLAPPLVLVGDYLAVTMGVTVTDPWWLRDLSGWVWSDSDPTTSVHPVALTTPAVLATGLLGAVLIAVVIARLRMGWPLRAAAGSLAASLALGVFAFAAILPVRDWTGNPPPWPRAAPSICTDDPVPICVYPESADQLPALRTAADQVLPRLERAGIPPPERLSHLSMTAEPPPGTWPLSLPRDPDMPELRQSVATSALGWPIAECDNNVYGQLVGDHLMLRAWLIAVAGEGEIPADGHTNGLSPMEAAAVMEVLELPAARQTEWFERNAQLLRNCEPAPELTTVRPGGLEG